MLILGAMSSNHDIFSVYKFFCKMFQERMKLKSCICINIFFFFFPLLHSFKDESHRDFVTGVAWSPVNLGSLTTVGWDHKVLHHSIQKENNPEPKAEEQA